MSGTWSSTEIAGKRADVFEPSSPRPGRAVIFLHGHGRETLVDKPDYTQQFELHGLRCVCPQGGRAWWLPFICPDFDQQLTAFDFVRENVVEWIHRTWNVEPPHIGLLGISMGGQGALQLAYRHGRQFPIVAALAPTIDFHRVYGEGLPLDEMFESAELARQQTAILHLHPLNWPRHQFVACDPADATWLPDSERLASKLFSSGIAFESDFETSRGGHNWDYFSAMAEETVTFLADAFDREDRRLV
ncbi:esterase [bacterium]|nr:esterase [bacterium]